MREHYTTLRDFFEDHSVMLPYKNHNFIRSYEERERTTQSGNERSCVDMSAFAELSRKVDWLVDEVRHLKQTLLSYERRELERLNYERYEQRGGERLPRERLATPHDRVETREIPSYYERSINYPENMQERENMAQPHSSVTYGRHDERVLHEHENESRLSRPRTFPYEVLSKSDHDSHYSSDSPVSNSSRSERVRSSSDNAIVIHRDSNTGSFQSIADDINIAEIILLWQRGMNDIPPIISWPPEQKLRHRNKLEEWFRVYHLFRVSCHGDIGRFISQFTDSKGKMMTASHVAGLCPDVTASCEMFLHSREVEDQADTPHDPNSTKVYILPRKINGRKVSAKDVIQLWEHGMGDIPPIKLWTKAQKFKQQSKISRWKKIVDIFKYQCHSDMRKFEEIYTDSHGCLLPVAAITTKFETIYGDELNITSKLMTVSTLPGTPTHTGGRNLKRSIDSQSEEDEIANKISNKFHIEGHSLPGPPSLIRKSTSPPSLLEKKSLTEKEKTSEVDTKELTVTPKVEVVDEDYVAAEVDKSSFHPFGQQLSSKSSGYSFDGQSSPSNSESEVNESDMRSKSDSFNEVYTIPTSASLADLIRFWDKGFTDFPPIKTWTREQKDSQREFITDIEKLFFIYDQTFKRDMNAFNDACVKEDGQPMSFEDVFSKFNQAFQEQHTVETNTLSSTSASSMTFDFSHHRTISQSTDALYLLPRKINGRKVSAKDVLQLWYHGLNKIPPVKQWSPQQKAVQQSKISRWKKIVDLFEHDFSGNWERFEKHFSNNLGQLIPITAIIAKHEEENRTMGMNGPNLYQ